MTVPTAAEYLWQFQRLLPRGRVWQRGWGTLQAAHLLTLMPSWVRLHARADNVLVDSFPCSTVELLPEWEATLGLPDPCVQPPFSTLQQRQLAVCSKFAARGGQSIDYFTRLAELYGFTIYIQTYAPFRCGINRCGQPLYGRDWAFAWKVEIVTHQAIIYFRTGASTTGEPLRAWGDEVIECLIRQYAPAHTIPIFSYVEPESIWDAGASIWDDGDSVWDKVQPPGTDTWHRK